MLTTPAAGWRSTAEEAPAVGRAPRHRQGPGPNERPHWWRTRRGRSYNMRMTPAAGWHGGAGRGPGAAVPALAGAEGAAALVENQARAQLHATHR